MKCGTNSSFPYSETDLTPISKTSISSISLMGVSNSILTAYSRIKYYSSMNLIISRPIPLNFLSYSNLAYSENLSGGVRDIFNDVLLSSNTFKISKLASSSTETRFINKWPIFTGVMHASSLGSINKIIFCMAFGILRSLFRFVFWPYLKIKFCDWFYDVLTPNIYILGMLIFTWYVQLYIIYITLFIA